MANGVLKVNVGGSWVPVSSGGGGTSGPHADTHEPGGTDAITDLNAATLTSGTVPDTRLSANVQMKPVALADLPTNVATKPVPVADGGTGVTTGLTVLVADALTSGTLPDARLSAQVARRDQANTFTTGQLINAKLDVTGSGGTDYSTAPIEVRRTENPRVSFHWPGIIAAQIGMDSAGTVRTYDLGTGYAPFAAGDITANGTGGNLARKDQANTFTGNVRVDKITPAYTLHDTYEPADQRQFRMMSTARSVYFQSMYDDGTTQQNVFWLNRVGDVFVGRDLYEKSRATPMGHWVSFTPITIDWTISTIHSAVYSLIGKTIFVCLRVGGSCNSAGSIKVQIPGGLTSSYYAQGQSAALAFAGAWELGWTATSPGGNEIIIYRSNLGSFPTAPIEVGFTITIPIN